MKADFFNTLNEVVNSFSLSKNPIIKRDSVITFSENKILTSIGDIYPLLSRYRSSLNDQFVDIDVFQKFVANLISSDVVVRINHIGCCYKVDSQELEKERLVNLIKNSKVHLYTEPSNDEGVWFFLGNADKWEDMMVELIPIEKTADKWKDYWLPHIHIDIDTKLKEEEIKKLIITTFGNSVQPFPITIDGVVYIVRNRLGVIDGINIMLDLATNSRNVKYQRLKLLNRIDDR